MQNLYRVVHVSNATRVPFQVLATSKVFEYLKKGTQVYVCGDVYADVFQKDDGSHIPSVSLTVSRIELLGKAEKKESGDGTASGQPQ